MITATPRPRYRPPPTASPAKPDQHQKGTETIHKDLHTGRAIPPVAPAHTGETLRANFASEALSRSAPSANRSLYSVSKSVCPAGSTRCPQVRRCAEECSRPQPEATDGAVRLMQVRAAIKTNSASPNRNLSPIVHPQTFAISTGSITAPGTSPMPVQSFCQCAMSGSSSNRAQQRISPVHRLHPGSARVPPPRLPRKGSHRPEIDKSRPPHQHFVADPGPLNSALANR